MKGHKSEFRDLCALSFYIINNIDSPLCNLEFLGRLHENFTIPKIGVGVMDYDERLLAFCMSHVQMFAYR